MAQYLITAQSADRPGIVAIVSGAVAEHSWSVEDATMTRLAGRFAMLLVINVSDGADADYVRDLLRSRLDPADIAFTLESVISHVPGEQAEPSGSIWSVTVYGADRPGIVSAIAHTLGSLNVNINNLTTRVADGPAGTVYTMLIDAVVPSDVDADAFTNELSRVGEVLGVTCHATLVDVDVL